VHTKGAEIKNGALMKLTRALVERLDKMPSSGVSEPLAMEYATALLLAESAFENYTRLSPDFPQQVDAMLARLDAGAAAARRRAGAPMLDEMSKRAQERVLLAQVGREIQVNLRHMEQVLDAFLPRPCEARRPRDARQGQRADPRCAAHARLDEAGHACSSCAAADRHVCRSGDTGQQRRPRAPRRIACRASASTSRRSSSSARPRSPDRAAARQASRRSAGAAGRAEADSVETAVAELRAALPEIVAEVQRAPADAAAREGLKQKLSGLRDDADLIGDAELVAQVDDALRQLEAAAMPRACGGRRADRRYRAAPAPEISEETQRLLATDASAARRRAARDLPHEAAEVLDTIERSTRSLRAIQAIARRWHVVRRQFHTLKGSGRMVGLTQLGDIAYEVERIHNRLIEEERPVTPDGARDDRVAARDFRAWVDSLHATRRVPADPAPIAAAVRAVEASCPGRRSRAAARRWLASRSRRGRCRRAAVAAGRSAPGCPTSS
jgi:chemosensory pili system protein ChpA (sensor histidine kinase/response regulator)